MLPAGLFARSNSGDFRRLLGHTNAHFLLQFADCRWRVVLASIQMTGNARIPNTGVRVLKHRPLLQKQIPAFVENENMHRPMQELFRMNFPTGFPADDLIILIHDVKNLA